MDSDNACVDIFTDFDETEIKTFPLSIQNAWEVGKLIYFQREVQAAAVFDAQNKRAEDETKLDKAFFSGPILSMR